MSNVEALALAAAVIVFIVVIGILTWRAMTLPQRPEVRSFGEPLMYTYKKTVITNTEDDTDGRA